MAWNSSQNKDLRNTGVKTAIGPGAPVAQNPNFAGRAYRDQWDIEQAYRQGVQKVTWVARCIDAISGNQARLPIVLRKNNSPDGEIVKSKRSKDSILDILNSKSNIGENSFIFRYRLSSQLLMGTRGAFIEKLRGRDGRIIGLNLLPPQSTAPIPHPKTFVSGYEVQMPDGKKIIMKPDSVVWIRRPHPLDPYLSLTPMESAGVAIEIENLAKLYNRNYLLNDGRPGGLLVVKGDIDDDDKMELRSRFRANLGTVGSTTVIAADDGVDYVDTSASPRDAAYIQMRQITKEEILASFGVPESVIGNASGRTFSNAGEEIRVFWSETMMPHLEHLARAFDGLDEKHYIDFDISAVPSLALYEQERNRYVKEEFQTGLISANEYREASGRKIVHSELGDSLLQNPNLTPIGNTHKVMETPNVEMGGPGGAPPGMPPPGMPGAPQPGAPGAPQMPGMPPGPEQPLDPNTMQGALAAQQGQPAPGQMSGEPESMSYKSIGQTSELERWTEILDRGLERLFERQQRVVLEKASGAKARKALTDGTLEVDTIMPQDVWDKQVDEDIRPVLNAIVKDATETYSAKSENYKNLSPDDIASHVNSQMDRIKSINTSSRETITNQILQSLDTKDPEERVTTLRSNLIGHFTHLLAKTRPQFAADEARRAWNLPSR
jgi:HK97 family phage portal protein